MTARWIVGIDGSDATADALRCAVGNAGRRGAEITALRHHLLGLVSQYCVTHSHAPVVVVPNRVPHVTSSIVVGLHGSDHAADTVRWAPDFVGPSVRS